MGTNDGTNDDATTNSSSDPARWYRVGTQTPEAARHTALTSAWVQHRDGLDAGRVSVLALLRRAVERGDAMLAEAVREHGAAYLASTGRHEQIGPLAAALDAVDQANERARTAALAALDKLLSK